MVLLMKLPRDSIHQSSVLACIRKTFLLFDPSLSFRLNVRHPSLAWDEADPSAKSSSFFLFQLPTPIVCDEAYYPLKECFLKSSSKNLRRRKRNFYFDLYY